MNPELERLLDALHEADTCAANQRAYWVRRYDDWFAEVAAKLKPGQTREDLEIGIQFLYQQRRRQKAQDKHTTLPPKA